MTYTKGPWSHSIGHDGTLIICGPSNGFCSDVLVRLVDMEPTDGSTEVNARLIAAAPDLLEALEEVTSAMRRYEMDVDADAPAEHREMMRKARAAIAKTRGRA